MNKIQQATLALRERTGCREYSVALEQGMARVVRITYDKHGKSTIKNVSEWVPVSKIVETLNAI